MCCASMIKLENEHLTAAELMGWGNTEYEALSAKSASGSQERGHTPVTPALVKQREEVMVGLSCKVSLRPVSDS